MSAHYALRLPLIAISLSLVLNACSALSPPPPPPPPQPSEVLLQARKHFEEGAWEQLTQVVKNLPSDGPFIEESYFYHAVTKGLKHPKYGLEDLKNRELDGSEDLRVRNQLYQLIFQGLRGECLLALGPLKAIYAPKLEGYSKGTRELVQEVLRQCDEDRASKMRQLSADLKEKAGQIDQASQSSAHQSTKQDIDAQKTVESSNATLVSTSELPLSSTQLQSVRPHIAFLLPKTKEQTGKVVEQLLEIVPIARERIEKSGKPFKIDILEPKGVEQITEQIINLDARIQLLVAFTLSRSLHNALIEASRAQSRPLIIMTPHPIQLKENDRIWRLFTTTESISQALINDAVKANAKRILLVSSSSSAGVKLAQEIRDVVQNSSSLEWEGHELTPDVKDSEGWTALAKQISTRSFDTLFIALSSTQTAQLATYLAAEGVWSAQGEIFEKPNPSAKQEKAEKNRSVRMYLWPSAYDQRALKQAGRYLEGARLASPVYQEGEAFQALSQDLEKEINRKAHLIDPLFLELISILDLPLRESLLRDQDLSELLPKLSHPEGLLSKLSFQSHELIGHLKMIEVQNQQFVLRTQAHVNESDTLPFNEPKPLSEQELKPSQD